VISAAAPPGEIEHNLVTRAQQGDREAFSELVRCHREGVINVVYRMCGDAGLAEDAAQEAFIRAWQHLASYQPRSPFRNWVYRIAANVALDVLRRKKETVDVEAVPVAAPGPGPEAALIEQERAERVRQAVLALPSASRAVLVLREYEGLSYQDIAYTLDIPMGTAQRCPSFLSHAMYARIVAA